MKKEKIVVDECTKQMGRQDRINYQFLYEVMNRVDLNICKTLVENGADVNAWNVAGDTPLIIALQKNPINIELIDFLLEQDDIDINSMGDSAKYKTPLMYAASLKPESDAIKICKMLIEKNANIDCVSNEIGEEWTAVDYAKHFENEEVVSYLSGQHTDLFDL